MNVSDCPYSKECYPEHDHHLRFDSDGWKDCDENGKVDIITNSSCDGVDCE